MSLITTHPFSAWDDILMDPTMTVAAVARLVHHALILEIPAESFRQQAAEERSATSQPDRPR